MLQTETVGLPRRALEDFVEHHLAKLSMSDNYTYTSGKLRTDTPHSHFASLHAAIYILRSNENKVSKSYLSVLQHTIVDSPAKHYFAASV